jgi:pilus assembly protein FimV
VTNKLIKSAGAWVLPLLAAWSINTHAAGLGPIKLQSTLGQAFAAEVEVIGLQSDDLLTAQARMATPEEFQNAKLPYNSVVGQIRVTIVPKGADKATLKLASNAPVTEPALNLLVEFSWRGNRILQKYAVLLDPPR